ncbi:MAG: lysophospholipid acyltransferase family protein [Flavobacteriales bacterium]
MQHEGAHHDDLLSRADLARWSGLPERHPLVGLLHRFGAVRQVNAEFEALSPLSGDAFIDAAFAALRMSLEIAEDDLQRIPETGPFVVVSNHPFGVLDALALIRHIRRRRPDFKLGVDGMLGATAQLDDALIVVSEGDPHGSRPKVSGWKQATEHLRSGGGFGVFPAGRVSSFRRSKRVVADGRWSASVAGWAVKQGCPVVPVCIDGANSPLFQLLGLIHPSLRSLRVAAELRNKKGYVLRMRIGRPIRQRDVEGLEGNEQLARFLRARTYALGAAFEVRREYFAGLRLPKSPMPIEERQPQEALTAEVAGLDEGMKLFDHGEFDIYLAPADRIPCLLEEIGRCREETFRAVGEGTNRSLDLDEYDLYYQHLILWDREAGKLAGAYRIGEGWVIMERYGARGFYTHSLFRMRTGFSPVLEASVELGRSFIVPEYQRQRMPLFLLWKGILSVLIQSPQARYILGPVTISSDYKLVSRSLIMEFVRRHYWDAHWGQFIRPRKRFAFEEKRMDTDALLEAAGGDVKRLDRILADIEPSEAVMPVLLKKYLHQNARILGFNRDPKFNNALDGLMLLDVQDLPAQTVENLQREFGLG